MTPEELERHIDATLRRLPAVRAPETLAPRIMRADEQQPRISLGWHGWWTWSRPRQVAVLAGLVLLLTATVVAWQLVRAPILEILSSRATGISHVGWIASGTSRALEFLSTVQALAVAGRAVLRPLQPLALGAAALLMAMSVLSFVFGAALRHIALGGAQSS